MTVTTDPTEVHIDRAYAYWDKESVHLYSADEHLRIDPLREIKLHVDDEVIPVFVGVRWSGDHTSMQQVHLPYSVTLDTESGNIAHDLQYDRVEVIDAAILGLERAKFLLLRAMGRDF